MTPIPEWNERKEVILVHRKRGKPMEFRRGSLWNVFGWYWYTGKNLYRLVFDDCGPWIGRLVGGSNPAWITYEGRLGAIGFETVKGKWEWQ